MKRVENFVEKNSKILSPNHYLILAQKSKYFFSFEDMNEGSFYDEKSLLFFVSVIVFYLKNLSSPKLKSEKR